jgi:hypothetical protein
VVGLLSPWVEVPLDVIVLLYKLVCDSLNRMP